MNILPKLLNCNTVDEKYNLLHEKLSLVIDKYAPMKEVKPHNDYDLKPWINEKIISKIKANTFIHTNTLKVGTLNTKKPSEY